MKEMSHFSWVLLLFATFAFAHGGCTDGLDCPESLPYCTPLGCVLSCPDNTFVNQTTCVHDCGNEFILNRECIPECPDSHPYIRRKIVSNQFRFHALKFCQDKCPADTLIHEKQCVEACPGNAPYVLVSNCSTHCPVTHRYHRDILKNGVVVAIECLSDCNGKFSFKYGNECLEACKPPLYSFDRECLDACPPSASFLLRVSRQYNPFVVTECKESCPSWTYQFNNTCVSNCPKNYFIYKDSMCVDRCPSDMPYVSEYSQVVNLYERKIFCVANCNPFYLNNGSCVKNCPDTMVVINNTCEQSCPPDTPFTCDEREEYFCRNRTPTVHFWEEDQPEFKRKCMNKCPEKMLLDGTICISKCSDSKKVFNNSCYDSCPKDFPYITSKAECVSKCPEHSYFDSGICVEHCTNKKFVLEENRICVNSCSLPKHVIRGNTCLQRCPDGMYNNSGICVENCPSSLSYNNTCIDKCPSLLLIKANDYSSTWHCTSECPDTWFTYNGTCVRNCDKKISPNNTCVLECPDSHPLLKNTGRPYFEKKWRCVDRCPDNQFISDGTCVEKCPKRIHFQNVCVNKCPASHPLITKSYSIYNDVACVDRCADNECLLNETCTKLYKVHNGVVLRGKCLQECPPGYVWLYVSTYLDNTGRACENSVTLLSVLTVVFVVMFFLWSFCCWKFSSAKDSNCRVLKFVYCERYYRKPQLDDEVLFLGTDFNKEDNGGFVNDELPTDITRTRGDGCEEMLLLGQTGVEHQETEDDAVKGTEADILIRNNASELEDDGRVCERDMLGISETNSLTGQPEILRVANGSPTDDNKVEVKVTVESLELKKYGAGK